MTLASELRAWLLYYSIPILFELLHFDYLLHTNLLVKALHILLNSEISSNDLSTAEIMLTVFYNKLLDLCPAEIWTMDVHSLIHLGETVKKLWASMVIFIFVFESMN